MLSAAAQPLSEPQDKMLRLTFNENQKKKIKKNQVCTPLVLAFWSDLTKLLQQVGLACKPGLIGRSLPLPNPSAGLGRGEKPGVMEDTGSFSGCSNTASLLLLVTKCLKTCSVPSLFTTGLQQHLQPSAVPHVQPHGSISAGRGHSTQSRLVTMAEL